MFQVLTASGDVRPLADLTALPADWLWLDLLSPTEAEEDAAEALLGLDLPTAEDMRDLELSSRLYRESGASFFTVNVLWRSTTDDPESVPVTLVLADHRLITVRYHEPSAFKQVLGASVHPAFTCGEAVFLALFEAFVGRAADALERASEDLKTVRRSIFSSRTQNQKTAISTAVLHHAITRVGRVENLISKTRDSLVSLARAISFITLVETDIAMREQTASVRHDIQALNDQATYLLGEVTFILDAALGLITVQQNAIVKIFRLPPWYSYRRRWWPRSMA